MNVGVVNESAGRERRVALVPAVIPALKKAGHEVLVETGAGLAAGYPDSAYGEKGATLLANAAEVLGAAQLIARVGAGAVPASPGDSHPYRAGQVVVAPLDPLSEPGAVADLARTGATAFALELVPRITRAQAMDILSSMATISGYKAVLLAASELPRLFPMMMTAAGTIAPAKVFVVGAGVAGLQAISTARRLGAVVDGYDVRPAVKEQVESLGARFVELPLETGQAEDKGGYAKAQDEEFYRRQREMMSRVVAGSDVVITTAAIPGRQAPILVTEEMIRGMAPGSVVVDLAAERGGNCEGTQPGERVELGGVTILGPVNLPATIPHHASQLFARNMANFITLLAPAGELVLNLDDEILRETLVTRGGEVVHHRIRELVQSLPASG